MNRRQALRNLGLGAGIIVVGPSTLSLLQSCKNETSSANAWAPTFLSAGNGFALQQILEVILPATETPGANDLNLAQFIDSYMEEVAPQERQIVFARGADAFAESFKNEFKKETEDGTPEEYEQMVAKYLKKTTGDIEEANRRNTETQDPMDKDPADRFDFYDGSLSYISNVRDMGIWAWKTNEQIGENVLFYDPIPGLYVPCGPVDELTNGKAMSL